MTESKTSEWLDDMTYQASKHIEQGKQRSHLLRGEKAKTRGAKSWADKQEIKADRQEVQLETQKVRLEEDNTKLQIAKDDRDYLKIYQPMHRVQLAQQLVKKSYKIGANPVTVDGQVRGAIASSTSPVVDFANNKTAETVEVKARK
jgi:hypothetical protein